MLVTTYRHISAVHGLCPSSRLQSARPHRFGSTIPEQPRHAGLVGQTEPGGLPEVGQLQRHLDVSVRTEVALLHEPLAVGVVDEDVKLEVGGQQLSLGQAGVDRGPALFWNLPLEFPRFWETLHDITNAVAGLVIDITVEQEVVADEKLPEMPNHRSVSPIEN